ncbi:MAG TPA: hypothetical protein VH418_06365 [Solirubrobacteraceae bacterium]|jgi:hypothetical protein
MRLYPVRPAATVAGDLAVLAAILVLAWSGLQVHDAIAQLAGLGTGMQDAGRSLSGTAGQLADGVRGGFATAADAAGAAPVVGPDIAAALRRAGADTAAPIQGSANVQARRLVSSGADVRREALSTANLLGWLIFLVPTGFLLAWYVPARVRQVRRLAGAARVLDGAPAVELARRAAYGLPYGVLVRRTEDPLGDLAAGRVEPLLEALRDDAGVPVRAYR